MSPCSMTKNWLSGTLWMRQAKKFTYSSYALLLLQDRQVKVVQVIMYRVNTNVPDAECVPIFLEYRSTPMMIDLCILQF